MGYKRAEWHSGLTYRNVCNECHQEVIYDDFQLDFRPWYADGFIYCPRCRTPLRHNENLAINKVPESGSSPIIMTTGAAAFCTNCGKPLRSDDNFCSGCGTPRHKD